MLIATSNKQQATSNKQQATSNRLSQPIFLPPAFFSNRPKAYTPIGSALISPNTNFYESYGTDAIQPYISDGASPRPYIF